ncbi:MAG: hypothetical protein Q9162_003196 [Coniocarpon cinnabarinum]
MASNSADHAPVDSITARPAMSDSTIPASVTDAGTSEAPAKELTGAQRKAAAKLEKAARRAAQKEDGPSSAQGTATNADGQTGKPEQRRQSQQSNTSKSTPQQLPTRARRPSITQASKPPSKPKAQKAKQLPFLAHLYNSRRRPAVSQLLHPPAHKDVHPSVQTLALHLESYKLCGSQARTVGLLLALKAVIQSYTTPQGTSLPRDLSSRGLSAQLNHVKTHGRPFCTAQSNAVRWLKNRIATLDPSMPEASAINTILGSIDDFIRERFTLADKLIAQAVAGTPDTSNEQKGIQPGLIEDGDEILVFGKSTAVCGSLREAALQGKRFGVVCVDAGRPLWEGRAMSNSLSTLQLGFEYQHKDQRRASKDFVDGGITSLTYVPLSQLHAHLMLSPVTKAILGASSVYSNGTVLGRAGQAQVAIAVRTECPGAQIFVLAESLKCAERAVLGTGSLAVAELAPEDELTTPEPELQDTVKERSKNANVMTHEKGKDTSENLTLGGRVVGWRENDYLYLMNLLHDVTPPDMIDAIITEVGTVPPIAAAAVGRMVGVGGELGEV